MRISERSCSRIEEINSAVDSEKLPCSAPLLYDQTLWASMKILKKQRSRTYKAHRFGFAIFAGASHQPEHFAKLDRYPPHRLPVVLPALLYRPICPQKSHYRSQMEAVFESNLYKLKPLPRPASRESSPIFAGLQHLTEVFAA